MLSPIGVCPYQDCDLNLASRSEFHSCACGLTRPLAFCAACGAENRAAARFCRRCRAELPLEGSWTPRSLEGSAAYLRMKGVYRRPPLTSFGSLFAMTTEGHLESVALRAGAASSTVAELHAAGACNRAALVNAPLLGKANPGWTFVAIYPGGVEAVILNTGEVRAMHKVRGGAELAVNPQGQAAPFRGVASDGAIIAFAERSAPDRITLAVRSFATAQPAERPLSLEGRDVIGPVLHSNLVVLCTNEEVGVYDVLNGTTEKAALPYTFEPLTARRQDTVNVPPGSIPLTAERSGEGLTVYIGGSQKSVPGLLNIKLATGEIGFDPLGQAGSITSNADGSLTLASGNQVQVVGYGPMTIERMRLHSGMPAGFDSSTMFAFAEEARQGLHRVAVVTPGRGKVSELVFEDTTCSEISCCAPLKTAHGVAVPYFDATAEGGSGSKVAFWNAGPRTQ